MNDDHEAIVEAVEEALGQLITIQDTDVFHKIYVKLNVPH